MLGERYITDIRERREYCYMHISTDNYTFEIKMIYFVLQFPSQPAKTVCIIADMNISTTNPHIVRV